MLIINGLQLMQRLILSIANIYYRLNNIFLGMEILYTV